MANTLSVDPNSERLHAVDEAILTPLVRKSLGSQTVTIGNWTCQSVSDGFGGGRGDTFIYRFTGQGDDQAVPVSWTLILKILRARDGEDPADPQYWKREGEIYRSGLLDNLPGKLLSARIFGVVEYPNEACWVWMEEIHDDLDQRWSLEHYGVAARHLGRFNGAYLVDRPLPAQPWLSSGWFRKQDTTYVSGILQVQEALNTPVLKRVFPGDLSPQFLRLWSERHLFLDALDRLPQTFCHLDTFRRNLIPRRGADGLYETVAIDWAYAGIAAIGAEISVPVVIGLGFFEIDAQDAAKLDTIIFNGYLNGLADAGWRGDAQKARLGYTIAVGMKTLECIHFMPGMVMDERNRAGIEQFMGHTMQDFEKQLTEFLRFAFRLADEARALMDTV